MDFQTAVKTCLVKKYMDFNGRATRSELWYFILFLTIISAALFVGEAISPTFFGILYILFWISTLIPGIAVWIRRLHDINKSGVWFLILLIPLAGLVFAIIWGCEKGTDGANNFGPDPLS